MTTTVNAMNYLVYASNPDVSCPAQDMYGSIEYQLDGSEQLTKMDVPIVDRIAAVIGPVVCKISECDHKCNDAYLGIENAQSIAQFETIGFSYAEVPVRIKTLEDKRSNRIAQISKEIIEPVFQERAERGYIGWDERCQNIIVDDLIDMHQGIFPASLDESQPEGTPKNSDTDISTQDD